jgi:flagellar biosynthetic protein FliR
MLSHFLVTELFAFLLVFCRLGSAIMLMPGFAEIYVAMRARLMLALMFSMILAPALRLPPPPADLAGLIVLMMSEILIGVFLGVISRMLIAAMHVAGTIIAFQAALSSALTVDIAGFQGQDTSLGNLLTMTAVVLLFVTDMHHVMLRGLADSYSLFIPGQLPLLQDFADHASRTMGDIFAMGVRLAAPNIVIGLMLNLGAGILARLMPNMQIFFIMQSPQLLLSFFVLMATFSAIMLWYIQYFHDALTAFLSPG